jgi:hypothetical protein
VLRHRPRCDGRRVWPLGSRTTDLGLRSASCRCRSPVPPHPSWCPHLHELLCSVRGCEASVRAGAGRPPLETSSDPFALRLGMALRIYSCTVSRSQLALFRLGGSSTKDSPNLAMSCRAKTRVERSRHPGARTDRSGG